MHVLEYHAIMVRVSMKVHHTDVNVNEVMKVPACDRQIDLCSSFVCYNEGVCHLQEYNRPVCQCSTWLSRSELL